MPISSQSMNRSFWLRSVLQYRKCGWINRNKEIIHILKHFRYCLCNEYTNGFIIAQKWSTFTKVTVINDVCKCEFSQCTFLHKHHKHLKSRWSFFSTSLHLLSTQNGLQYLQQIIIIIKKRSNLFDCRCWYVHFKVHLEVQLQ